MKLCDLNQCSQKVWMQLEITSQTPSNWLKHEQKSQNDWSTNRTTSWWKYPRICSAFFASNIFKYNSFIGRCIIVLLQLNATCSIAVQMGAKPSLFWQRQSLSTLNNLLSIKQVKTSNHYNDSKKTVLQHTGK